MNRNALTEQRRETVIGLLKSMDIKKSADGGFDKDDVYDCMQQLCDLYEKSIEELENAYESELGQLKDRYQKYDENNELYVSLIMEAKKSSNDIISQAKTEVETILAEGKEQVALQEKELSQLRIDMEAEKEAMIAELTASREAFEAEKVAMKAEVEAEREKAMAAKNKFTQQINSMEGEFEEIKTNILRTAGKMDSLKSKLPNDDKAEWKMMNDLDAVDFPSSEIEVESMVEAPVAVESIVIDEPAEEAVVETAAVEAPVAEAAPEVHTEEPAEEAFVLEDLISADSLIPESEPLPIEELSLEDIEIDLPELTEDAPAEEGNEEDKKEEKKAPVEEISFEGLEELFKED